MAKRTFPESELIINGDGSCFHLHLKPEFLADKVILVGDPARVNTVAAHFDSIEHEVSSREFHTITGMYKGKRITASLTASVATTSTSWSTSSTPWPTSTTTPVRRSPSTVP